MPLLEQTTRRLKHTGRKALVPYFTANYPSEKAFVELLLVAQDAGADVIEIGVPFSDPVADGVWIQRAAAQALQQGFTLDRFVSLLREIRGEIRVPLVVMTYLNPIYQWGLERFADFMGELDLGGIIFPDLPVEESAILRSSFHRRRIPVVYLVAPSTSPERARRIVRCSRAFIYAVALYGVTGVRQSVGEEALATVRLAKGLTDKPVYAGFGISTPEHAAAVAVEADGVIVGSAITRLILERNGDSPLSPVRQFLAALRRAL